MPQETTKDELKHTGHFFNGKMICTVDCPNPNHKGKLKLKGKKK